MIYIAFNGLDNLCNYFCLKWKIVIIVLWFSEKTNKTAPFPACCPIFACEDGVKLEYPELPTPAAPAADAEATTEKPKKS